MASDEVMSKGEDHADETCFVQVGAWRRVHEGCALVGEGVFCQFVGAIERVVEEGGGVFLQLMESLGTVDAEAFSF